MPNWFDRPERDDETPVGENLPGIFGFLGSVLHGITDAWGNWVNEIRGGYDDEPTPTDSWLDLGRVIRDAGETFRDADQELAADSGDYYGFEAATAFDDFDGDMYFERPPEGEKWEERKTFASYLDVLKYLENVQHIETRIVYEHGLYTAFIRGS